MDSRFYKYVELIIDNLEGGYYHPKFLNNAGVSEQTKEVYSKSGETMYGMDRVAGAGLFKDGAGKEFWDLIDANKANWEWFYQPPASSDLAKKLKKLVAEIQYKNFCNLADQFLKDQKTRKIVESSPKLMVHFFYGCWNGAGFFQNYAKKITEAVTKKGITNTSKLAKIAMDHRRNYFSKSSTWYKQFNEGADKIEKRIFPKLPPEPSSAWIWWLIGGVAVVGGGLFYAKKKGLIWHKK